MPDKAITYVAEDGSRVMQVSNGATWIPLMPGVRWALAASAVPTGLAPTGTVGANGAITLGTALNLTYSAGIYLYFPAGALFSGSAAGSYWCVMSSTTVGTAFNNVQGAIPLVPTTTTAIVDAGPGAYTGQTTAVTVFTKTLVGGTMGGYGQLLINYEFNYNNTAGLKTLQAVLGINIVQISQRSTSTIDSLSFRIKNTGFENRNAWAVASEATAAGTNAAVRTTEDTSVDVQVAFKLSRTVATDTAVLGSGCIELIPGVQ
jgi:hypothetical protein